MSEALPSGDDVLLALALIQRLEAFDTSKCIEPDRTANNRDSLLRWLRTVVAYKMGAEAARYDVALATRWLTECEQEIAAHNKKRRQAGDHPPGGASQ